MAFTLAEPLLSADTEVSINLACDPAVDAATRESRAAQLAMVTYPHTGVWPEGFDVPQAAGIVIRPLTADERDQATVAAGVAPPLGAKVYQRYLACAGDAGVDAAEVQSLVNRSRAGARPARRQAARKLEARRIDPDAFDPAEHRAAALEEFIGTLEMHERHALTAYQLYAARRRAIVLRFGWVRVEQAGQSIEPDDFIRRLDSAGFAHLSDRVRAEVAQHVDRLTYARPAEKK